MPARFCPQCGTKVVPQAKFCMECGHGLVPGSAAPSRIVRRSVTGYGVFAAFLLSGLGIWAAILTPDAPPPPLGGARPAAGATTPPAGEPAKVELPAEITKMVGELAAKADAKPDDLGLWTHLGEVYYRTAQFDHSYYPKALAAFEHVLARDAKQTDAIRGKANIYYDRSEPALAIPLFERYLALKGDDPSVRTDLATMHLYAGDAPKAIAMYKDVLAKDPRFVQAHYNLAAAYHEQGDDAAALDELRTARRFATDERVQQQIDQMIAKLSGAPAPAAAPVAPAPAAPGETTRTPFQQLVEQQLRGHEIVGPRIAELRWTAPGRLEARMREFPMAQMPPMARTAFEKRMVGYLEDARKTHPVDGAVAIVMVDADTGDTMATITP
jgi:cytochrome c-type biogenesis protein CcmH/NrfG